MELDSKYYTPEIEEFHIGFEYERRGIKDGQPYYTPMIYGKEVFKIDYAVFPDFLEKDVNNTRVKYLDKEDIESLEWTLSKDENSYIWFDKPDKSSLLWWKNSNHCELDCEPEYDLVYRGPIKNKFELIKLMKQLNIK